MKLYKNLLLILVCSMSITIGQAQVKFKLTQLADGETYQVSLISDVTYLPPMNATSTAQITLKVPSGGLEVDRIVNLQEGTEWEPNSRTYSPVESPESDYISFGLVTTGTKKLNYQAGIELPLFTFTNIAECNGRIALINHQTDPFLPPNSRQVNVGNQITILGANGDAYKGNTEDSFVICGEEVSTSIEKIDQNQVDLSIFPNPAKTHISVKMDWARKGELIELNVLDMAGKTVIRQKVDLKLGENQERIDLQSLAQGNYFIELKGADWKISSDQFVKMNH